MLVGGLYGVAIGGIFFTESLFSHRNDASKVAFVTLNCHLQKWGFKINDLKSYSDHHASQGGRLIKRSDFLRFISEYRDLPTKQTAWEVDKDLNIASWNPKLP